MVIPGYSVHPHVRITVMMSQKQGLRPPSATRSGSKSAGSSPFNSPTLNRKVLATSKQAETYKQLLSKSPHKTNTQSDDSNESLINITVVDSNDNKILLENDKLKCCPCGKSDSTSTYVLCTKCQQEWHNKCCNLNGITQAAVKKLKDWECPRCFMSPFVTTIPKESDELSSVIMNKFLGNITWIEACTEELMDSATTIEFFNSHIKHLLLHDDQFKDHTSKMDCIVSNIESINTKFNDLHETCLPSEDLTSTYVDVSTRVKDLTEEVHILSTNLTSNKCDNLLSQETVEAIEKVAIFPVEKLLTMEKTISELSDKISSFQQADSGSSKIYEPFNTQETDGHGTMLPNTISPKARNPMHTESGNSHSRKLPPNVTAPSPYNLILSQMILFQAISVKIFLVIIWPKNQTLKVKVTERLCTSVNIITNTMVGTMKSVRCRMIYKM